MKVDSFQSNSLSYRWDIAVRCLLAFAGGLVWTSVFGALTSVLLDQMGVMPLVQAAHIMTLFSFLPWCGIAMWVFYERELKIVIGWLGTSSALMFLVYAVVR